MSRVRGAGRIRSLLKRLPDQVRSGLAVELQAAGVELLAAMKSDAPQRTGEFARALSFKFYDKTLRLRVGLLGKPTNRRIFYARILEFGRKAQTVQVQRRAAKTNSFGNKYFANRKASDITSTYAMRVSALPARHTVYTRRTDLRTTLEKRLKDIFGKAIAKAAAGASGD